MNLTEITKKQTVSMLESELSRLHLYRRKTAMDLNTAYLAWQKNYEKVAQGLSRIDDQIENIEQQIKDYDCD